MTMTERKFPTSAAHAQQQQADAPQAEFGGITLMPDERIVASLGMAENDRDRRDQEGDAIALTDSRVILTSAERGRQRAAFMAIDDISAVEIARRPEGYSNFVWAGIAFFVAAMLWRAIDSQTLAIAATAIVALMGVYLVIDRLTSRGNPRIAFKAATAELDAAIADDGELANAHALANKLFELKQTRAASALPQPRIFAPR